MVANWFNVWINSHAGMMADVVVIAADANRWLSYYRRLVGNRLGRLGDPADAAFPQVIVSRGGLGVWVLPWGDARSVVTPVV